MTLYTDKVVAEWIGVTPRRVRQLRDEGVLPEKRRGLWDLKDAVRRYTSYLRRGSDDLNAERTKLTAEKRKAAEMDNAQRRGELHKTEDIERGLKGVFLRVRGRLLALPAKLAPAVAKLEGDRAAIYDELERGLKEALEELSEMNISASIDTQARMDWSEGERRAAKRPGDQPETEGSRAVSVSNASVTE